MLIPKGFAPSMLGGCSEDACRTLDIGPSKIEGEQDTATAEVDGSTCVNQSLTRLSASNEFESADVLRKRDSAAQFLAVWLDPKSPVLPQASPSHTGQVTHSTRN
jgi:hypothetical protein